LARRKCGEHIINKSLFFGAALACALSQFITPLSHGAPVPVGAWLGEGNANDSFGTNDGTPGTTTGYVAGVFGQAFDFSGADSTVNLPVNAFASIQAGDVTIVSWINTTQGGDYSAVQFESTFLLYFDASEPGIITSVWDGDFNSRLSSGTTIQNNGWKHVASVYDTSTSTASIYVGGVLKASEVRLRTVGNVNKLGAGIFNDFSGLLDEVAIYGTALTQSEITDIMTLGIQATVPLPGAVWLFGSGLIGLIGVARKRNP